MGEALEFSEQGFFFFILPPIIFAAGYTLKRKNFFRNIAYITLLGLVGTLFSMAVLAAIMIMLNDKMFPLGSA